MRLSTKCRYGSRAMVDIAVHSSSGPVRIAAISKRQRITRKYLEQLFIFLKGRGLIRSIRGANGGFILGRSANHITLYDIYEALEGPLLLVHCIDYPASCPLNKKCVTRGVWRELQADMQKKLSKIRLSDLVKSVR